MPRVNWKGTGAKYVEVPGVGPRGLVVLQPGVNTVTDQELAAMQVAAKIDLDAGTIEILQEVPDQVVPGMVDTSDQEPPEAPSGADPEGSA